MSSAPYDLSVGAARADALFPSALQTALMVVRILRPRRGLRP
jgi:hypothetical protein